MAGAGGPSFMSDRKAAFLWSGGDKLGWWWFWQDPCWSLLTGWGVRPGPGLGMCRGGGHHKIDSVPIFTLSHENLVPDKLEHWMSLAVPHILPAWCLTRILVCLDLPGDVEFSTAQFFPTCRNKTCPSLAPKPGMQQSCGEKAMSGAIWFIWNFARTEMQTKIEDQRSWSRFFLI